MSTSEPLDQARERLRETAAAMTRLLQEDLSGYPERELQRRFVQAESADDLTDAQVRTLRRASAELGKVHARKIGESLSRPEPWEALAQLDALDTAPEQFGSLREVGEVWRVISAVDADLEALARQYHLPADDRTPPGYSPPARFIQHQHLPSLFERYLREVGEVRRLGAQDRAESLERERRSRSARWAAAETGT